MQHMCLREGEREEGKGYRPPSHHELQVWPIARPRACIYKRMHTALSTPLPACIAALPPPPHTYADWGACRTQRGARCAVGGTIRCRQDADKVPPTRHQYKHKASVQTTCLRVAIGPRALHAVTCGLLLERLPDLQHSTPTACCASMQAVCVSAQQASSIVGCLLTMEIDEPPIICLLWLVLSARSTGPLVGLCLVLLHQRMPLP